MATAKGAAGPSQRQSRENRTGVWAWAAADPRSTAAPASMPLIHLAFIERSTNITVTSVFMALSRLAFFFASCLVLDHAIRSVLRVKSLARASLPPRRAFDKKLSRSSHRED